MYEDSRQKKRQSQGDRCCRLGEQKAPGNELYIGTFLRLLKTAITLLEKFWRGPLFFTSLSLLSEPPHPGQRHGRPFIM